MKKIILNLLLTILLVSTFSCETAKEVQIEKEPYKFDWDAATVYFLLTDRFNNGDKNNDLNFDRTAETGPLRNFMGGDIKGITAKINEGYFDKLGIEAIWFSPVFEQIQGYVDEGSGLTYGYHGYWIKDWTNLDPNFGTMEDLKEMIDTAHGRGIRILLDVVLNHTGPVTPVDPVWPESWVRTSPTCTYQNFETTANCTLVENLPDIKTESIENVELPEALVEKWKNEGRYEKEMAELDEFFKNTKYSKAPRFYIMKWLTDYIREFGIDGFRVDTAKHLREDAWSELSILAHEAFKEWKENNPNAVLDENKFFMLAEVYGYGISGKRNYNFGDRKVDYFDNGFKSLINFEFVYDAEKDYDFVFHKYDSLLNQPEMKKVTVMNYISSHDDGNPFDGARQKTIESANKLLLTPGMAQIYYGDESARSLEIPGTEGDATLRSFMNWEDLSNPETKNVFDHWSKLGQFRKLHKSIANGTHQTITSEPYVFSRSFNKDKVVIGLELNEGKKTVSVGEVFENGSVLIDSYSNTETVVNDGMVEINSPYKTVLLAYK
ncbi:alpha-amylase family glycosyl hydrolase [Fulvivirga lutimaris]|uniref:alpha-amylase family glycosyl hydrolase n=1 Tax=Fulvivirga lutimaris TaxID=1819566 RepID=UPI0012BB5833|nr:alpha-amylase family glycosyl hydrolase [Fulvivirga lutimaris]MTI38268.1 alpha-amlyase [Fulvivirga lutimaris]